jgi:hypothetical protein
MKVSVIIQRVVAILIFLTGFVFGILGLFGVTVTVNQADVNNIIFGLGALIAAAIEFVPMLLQLMKDKEFREVMSIVNDVVWSVEEIKGISGPEKKRRALAAVQKIMEERGLTFDINKVDRMIESVIDILNTVTKEKR